MSIDIVENKLSIKSCYRPEIDGLRAFAVVTVIINHFNKEILPNGYLGVDIFFVISGFIITSSLYQRPSKNFKDFISGFYERRIKRLFPALSIFVLITSITICLFNPESGTNLKTGISSLFGLSNLYLFKESTAYFAQATELNAFTHTWSLGVEEQFYVIFPVLIWFSGFGRQIKNGARNLFVIIGTLGIASLIGFLYLYPINQTAAYYLMPTRFWEIASGCVLFIESQKKKSLEQFFEKVPPLLLLTLIIGVMCLPTSLAIFSTIAVVVLSTMLIASLKKQTAAFTFFTNPKVVYVGLISYSLYLWHWGILSISRWTIGVYWWTIPFQLVLIFCLSVASYQYIETPLRKSSWFKKKWKTFLAGIGVLMALSMNLVVLGKTLKGKLFIGNQYNKWNMHIYGGKRIINNPKLPTIYLIGDSHAGHYGSVMTNLASKKEFNFVMHPQVYGINVRNKKSKENILVPLREYKKDFKKGDIIIFSGHPSKYTRKENWTKHYETFMQETKNYGMKFILISPTPSFSGVRGGYTCQEEWYRPSWAISSFCFGEIKKSEWFASNSVSIANIKKFLLANPNVSYIDAFSILCPDSYCKNHDQKILSYKDSSHLTSYSAMKLKNTIETFIWSK